MGRKHLLHYKNGTGTTKPSPINLEHGEIAVQYTTDHEKMYIKSGDNRIIDFSSDHLVNDRMDTQDGLISNALGLEETDVAEEGRKSYAYKPTNTLLQGFNSMNESVDYLADELKNCLELIATLKANAYMIEANFKVEANDAATQETISFDIRNNGNTTVPKSVVVKKSVNNGAEVTIINSEGQSTGSTTSTIEGAVERYTATITPNLTGALDTKIEETRYLCFIGAYSGSTILGSQTTELLNKVVSNGDEIHVNVETQDDEYIYICVPEGLRVYYVTNNGMEVSLYDIVKNVPTTYGRYNCYRNLKKLSAYNWNLVIKHKQ